VCGVSKRAFSAFPNGTACQKDTAYQPARLSATRCPRERRRCCRRPPTTWLVLRVFNVKPPPSKRSLHHTHDPCCSRGKVEMASCAAVQWYTLSPFSARRQRHCRCVDGPWSAPSAPRAVRPNVADCGLHNGRNRRNGYVATAARIRNALLLLASRRA
jgi:hypothetical protein